MNPDGGLYPLELEDDRPDSIRATGDNDFIVLIPFSVRACFVVFPIHRKARFLSIGAKTNAFGWSCC